MHVTERWWENLDPLKATLKALWLHILLSAFQIYENGLARLGKDGQFENCLSGADEKRKRAERARRWAHWPVGHVRWRNLHAKRRHYRPRFCFEFIESTERTNLTGSNVESRDVRYILPQTFWYMGNWSCRNTLEYWGLGFGGIYF